MYKFSVSLLLALLFALPALAQTHVFAQLQGAPANTTGWNFAGAAKVANVTGNDFSEILLTPNVESTSGAIFFNQPINLSMCKKWKAEFDYRINDGPNGGGDGLAFCFLDVPPTGFENASNLGIPRTANGLKICIDSWNNCSQPNGQNTYQMPKVEMRWGPGYGIFNQAGQNTMEGECRTEMPTAFNANGQLNYLRSPSYNHVIVSYNDGKISVTIGTLEIFKDMYQQFNFAGYLGFVASTGGFRDNHSIKNVIIYTEMPPSVAGVPSHAVCPGDTLHAGTDNNPAYTYSWSPGAGVSNAAISNPVLTASNITGDIVKQTFYVKTAFSSNPGCASLDSITLTVNPGPITDFEVPVVCLPNGNVIIKNTTVINDGTQSQLAYDWSFADGGTSKQTNAPHTYTSDGNYGITLKATSPNGCERDITKQFVINPQAKASISAAPEFCQDTTTVFNGSLGGAATQKWQWSFGDNSTDTVQNPLHAFATAKTFTVKMYGTTQEGCKSDTATASIVINPLPVAAMFFDGLQCEGKTLAFHENANPSIGSIASRTWGFDDGTTANTKDANHSFSVYGKHTVNLAVQNTKGCKSKPYAVDVTINPKPAVNFGTPAICKGVGGIFTDSSKIADGTQGQFGYQWSFGDGGLSPAPNPSHTYPNPGNYNVKLVVTSNNNCVDSTTKVFAVSDYPVIDFQILTTNFCGNLPLQLRDNSSVQYGTIDSLKVFWDDTKPENTNFYLPVKGSEYTHIYPSFGYTNSLQVTLKVQAYSSGLCYTEKTGVSVLFASPKLVFDKVPVYCSNDKMLVTLTQARDTTIFQGSGFYSGPGVSNDNFNPSIAGPGDHKIIYTYTLSNSCSDTVSQIVHIGNIPVVTAGPQGGVILTGGQITLDGSALGGDNIVYSWSPALYLSDNTVTQPVAAPPKDTYYTLKATNADGCFDTSGVLIKVLQFPVVPNAFSPNGDGINDTWQISYITSYPDCKIQVFNRYGQVVFTSTGYTKPWDGTLNGKVLPVGTYYYIVSTSHLPKPITGNVTILR